MSQTVTIPEGFARRALACKTCNPPVFPCLFCGREWPTKLGLMIHLRVMGAVGKTCKRAKRK